MTVWHADLLGAIDRETDPGGIYMCKGPAPAKNKGSHRPSKRVEAYRLSTTSCKVIGAKMRINTTKKQRKTSDRSSTVRTSISSAPKRSAETEAGASIEAKGSLQVEVRAWAQIPTLAGSGVLQCLSCLPA